MLFFFFLIRNEEDYINKRTNNIRSYAYNKVTKTKNLGHGKKEETSKTKQTAAILQQCSPNSNSNMEKCIIYHP